MKTRRWLKTKLGIWWHKPQDPSDRRVWIHLGSSCLTIESRFLRRARGCRMLLKLNSGDGDQITAGLAIPMLFSIWVSIEGRFLRRLMPGEMVDSRVQPGETFWMPTERQIGVRIFDSAIWVSLWENPMEWNRSDPRWWAFNFQPIDFLFGQERMARDETKSDQDVSVRMPEGVYTGKLRLYRVTHKRPRWPTARHVNRYRIEMDDPIPVPGKGESAWDVGEDAVYSISGVASTADKAVIRLLDSVNTSRVRYGGAMWLPEGEGAP